jgi:hypothetical protein
MSGLGFNIDTFKTQGLYRGGARPSLFKVRFAKIPQGVSTVVQDASSDLEFVCRAASVPGSSVDPVEVRYFGRPIQLAGNRTFRPWTITVMNDEHGRHRTMFEAWHNKINALVSNRQDSMVTDMLDYKVPANVLQFGKAGPGDDSGIIKSYQFEGLFPIDVGEMQLDWDAGNVIQTFDVTCVYDYWVPVVFDGESIPYSPTLSPDPQVVITGTQ